MVVGSNHCFYVDAVIVQEFRAFEQLSWVYFSSQVAN